MKNALIFLCSAILTGTIVLLFSGAYAVEVNPVITKILYNEITNTKIAIKTDRGEYEIIPGNEAFFYYEMTRVHPRIKIIESPVSVHKYDQEGAITQEWKSLSSADIMVYR